MSAIPAVALKEFTEEDLPELLDVLHSVTPKWERIATFLKLNPGVVAIIKAKETAEPEDKLLDVITRWLKRTDPPPTAEALINVLKKPFVGEEKVALEVRRRFCPPSFHGEPFTMNCTRADTCT